GYYGPGYLEMKRDAKDGKYYIIEPNIGRPTGRSALAEASGVELLYTQYCDLTGQPLPENRQQKYKAIKWIYLRRDLQSSLKYWKQGDLTLFQWLKSIRGKKVDALFSWKDPKPFLGDWARAIKQAFRKKETKKRMQKTEVPEQKQEINRTLRNGKVETPPVRKKTQSIF
ncbi:MAG: hypothetical protein ACE5I1_28720, partial [bacterium]